MRPRYAIPVFLALSLAVCRLAKSDAGFKAALLGLACYLLWLFGKCASAGLSFLEERAAKKPQLACLFRRIIPGCLMAALMVSLIGRDFSGALVTLGCLVLSLLWLGKADAEKRLQDWHDSQARHANPLFAVEAGVITMDDGGKEPRKKAVEDLGRVVATTWRGPYGVAVYLQLLFRDGARWEVASANPCCDAFSQSLGEAVSLNREQLRLAACAEGNAMVVLWENPSFSPGFSFAGWLEQKEREEQWYEPSELFVDNEICWRGIVRDCVKYDLSFLRQVFFEEVAPYCGPNLCITIPPVWSAFDRNELVAGIRHALAWSKASLWQRCMREAAVCMYRLRFLSRWKALAVRLEKAAAARTPEELNAILADPLFDPE